MKNEEIYKQIDVNLKRGREELVAHARTRRGKDGKKYEYYGQFIFMEYKYRTAEAIRKELIDAGVTFPPSTGNIWNIKAKIMDHVETLAPKKDGVKMCRRCKKRPIKAGNVLFCKVCHDVNKKIAGGINSGKHSGASQYIGV